MSRLDLAKMAVEDIVRGLNKRVTEHNVYLQQNPALHQSLLNMGLGFSPKDEFLLLSTGRQHVQQPATAACGAGGRLLVGYGDHAHEQALDQSTDQALPKNSNVDSFQRQLKRLQATDWEPGRLGPKKKHLPFPEEGGGIVGLNTALSVGLQLLSRYRLNYRSTENFGMGRLPSPAVLNPSGGPAMHALQPASLIVITDGSCLRSSPNEGGGPLKLQFGNMPLREFYQEPFRWDQRIFCLGVGAKEGTSSSQFLHPHLRALCEVTGGSHSMLRSSTTLAQSTELLLQQIAPPRPRDLPMPDPLRLHAKHSPLVGATGTFVSGGPVCCFQALETDIDTGQAATKHRALLLYCPHEYARQKNPTATTNEAQESFSPPTWCIPESFFPSKKLDSLPPRSSQPHLLFSRFPMRLGSKSFDPAAIVKSLARLDQLVLSNRKHQAQVPGQSSQGIKLLSRDVYVCEWISTDAKPARGPDRSMNIEYFPVMVIGAARQALSDGDLNYLNIGILHVPSNTSTFGSTIMSGTRVSTLTLLPPEPHLLLPLLIRAAEAEHRAIKKLALGDGNTTATNPAMLKKLMIASRNVQLDDHWRNEFRAYMFRIPPYYQNALKRSLRNVLPASAHSLLNNDAIDGALISQCFSKNCFQKIRNAEQMARENNERLERQETEVRRRGILSLDTQNRGTQQQLPGKRAPNEQENVPVIGYGQYDPRSSVGNFLAALRNIPAPWRVGGPNMQSKGNDEKTPEESKNLDETKARRRRDASEALGDLPAECLMAYYESRRRWIFGGSGITTRGLFADGVPNDGSNVQRCGKTRSLLDESLLSFANVGVSQMNATTTMKMGDYRERLLWSRAPVVGYGANDCTGVSATTAPNGAPRWSVDDDAMPVTFFNPKTGDFADSVQARVRSRLMVNFGNPYKDKRADSLIPEDFLSQSPHKTGLGYDGDINPLTPPGSPPNDSYSATEGEGEAVFAIPIARVRKSPSRVDSSGESSSLPSAKRRKTDGDTHDTIDGGSTLPASPESSKKILPPPQRAPALPGTKSESKDEVTNQVDQAKPPLANGKMVNAPKTPVPPPRPPPKSTSPPNAQLVKQRLPPPAPPLRGPPPKPPVGKGPPPKGPPRRGSAGERPPAPPSRPGPPPPKPNANRAPPPPPPQQSRNAVPETKPQAPPPTVDMQSADRKPNVDLPPGWITVWSKSQQRWYFFCTKTNKSVWQWPPP